MMPTEDILGSEYDETPTSFENVDMILVDEDPPYSEAIQKSLTLEGQLTSNIFGAILIFCLIGAFVFIINIYTNQEIVDVEVKYGYGFTVGWFFALSLLGAILLAHMVYKPYILDRANGSSVILYALIFYILAEIFWSTALFHSRINRGVATLAGIFLLAATVWIGWACYHFVKESVYIFLILLIWCFFLQEYTYNVDSHPWTGVPIGDINQ
jgi:hypothetical protein